MNKQEWKSAIRKTQYMKGKKLTKQERLDIMNAQRVMKIITTSCGNQIVTFQRPKVKKENWKEPNQPKSIGDILK